MTKKEKEQNTKENAEEVVGAPVEGSESPEDDGGVEKREQFQEQLDALNKQLEEAEAKSAENLDGWQRSQAEFINYKKRIERDREIERADMKGDIIRKILPVLDDLELALANRPEGDSWAEGMELVVHKFQNVLESEGVTRMQAAGQQFDPNYHEAISSEPSEEVESGYVIDVVKNGYILGERIIRPAVVRVAE